MRAFIAADIPYHIRERLADVSLALGLSETRAVDKNNMHLTLAFLEELENREIGNAREAMDRARFDRFDVSIKGVYCFGNPGAIYSAVASGADKIIELARSLRVELAASDINFDKKDFVPHVTIARMKGKVDEETLTEELCRFANREFGSYTLDTVSLFKSILGPEGPRYEGLYERKAGGA